MLGIITAKQFREKYGTSKKHKFSAKRTRDLDGVECPSWLHAEVANELIRRRNMGVTKGFDREVAIRLAEKCNYCGSNGVVYKVDFVERFPTHDVYIEAKGAEVASYRKRKKLWKETGPGALEVWKGRYHKGQCIPYLAEPPIIPEGMK